MRIPVQLASVSPVAPSPPPPPVVEDAPAEYPPLQIILLDDDPITTKLSKRILESAGHTVRTFTDGKELLALEPLDADVIVSDLNMPGSMNGTQVAIELRARGYRGALIAHTGDHFAHGDCLANGFDAVLAKPSTATTYVDTIQSVHSKVSTKQP